MDKDPEKEDIVTGDMGRFDLKKSEGIPEAIVFSYDPELNVLVMQSKLPGITEDGFALLLKDVAKINTSIEFHPILTRDAYGKVFGDRIISKFRAKISKPANPGMYGKTLPLNGIIDYMASMDGMDIEVTVKAKDNGLKKGAVQKAVDWLLKDDLTFERQVIEAKVDGVSRPVNLLMDCIREKVSISFADTQREPSVYDLYTGIKRAWAKRYEEVKNAVQGY